MLDINDKGRERNKKDEYGERIRPRREKGKESGRSDGKGGGKACGMTLVE